MDIKKIVSPDPNSWLVKYIIRYFKSIELTDGVTLWDNLVGYFKPSNGECEYLFNSKGKHSLYPVLSYDHVKHQVVLLNFEWICEDIERIKTGDFLKQQSPKTPVVLDKAQPLIESEKPRKRGFLCRLFKRHKPVVESNPNSLFTQNSFYQESEFKPLDNEDVTTPVMSKEEFEESGKFLAELNGINVHQAKEMLLSASYNRQTNRSQFISRLETDQVLGQQKLTINFNLKFLFDSGVLNSATAKTFKESMNAAKSVNLEFEIIPVKVQIDPQLAESQLIKL